jgi:uncharacterized protein
MQPPSNKDHVLHAWQAFATGDPERVSAVLTADAQWLAPAGNATAMAIDGTHHLIGRDRIVRFITREFPAVFVADRAMDVRHLFADGDTVILEARLRATLATGGHYDNEYCFLFELSHGRIHRVREYMDTRRGAELFRAGDEAGRSRR